VRRIALVGTVIGMTCFGVQSAGATGLVGDLSVTMNYKPNCGSNTADCTSLTAATALDFILSAGGTASPGVAGVETVTQATGDFSGLVGMTGDIKDFSFAGAGTINFPTPTVLAWESIGGLTFDLLTVQVDFVNSTALLLSGTGLFHMAGFEDTAGTFTLSANKSGTTFSASASKGTVPDAGSSILLLGMAFSGVMALRRRLA
jgi:hypothetical protein